MSLNLVDNTTWISNHVERHIGEISSVYHELSGDNHHLDILIVNPSEVNPFYSVVTCGMSNLPRRMPEGYEEFAHAELMFCLPADWPMNNLNPKDLDTFWPIGWLRYLGLFPHRYNTWLGWGHTIPNGDPPAPLASNTRLSGMLIASPILFEENFRVIDRGRELPITILSVLPIYPEEMDFKLKFGTDSLLEKFNTIQMNELIQISRVNACAEQ